MSKVFLLPLALTILCNAEEIPFWTDSFGSGAEEFWRHASQRGLENDDLHDLMGKIQEGRVYSIFHSHLSQSFMLLL